MRLEVRETVSGAWQYRISTSDGEVYLSTPVWANKRSAVMAGGAHIEHLADQWPQAWYRVDPEEYRPCGGWWRLGDYQ